MPNPVMHFELIAKDPATLRMFYGALFDWTEEDYPEAAYTILKHNSGHGVDFAIGAEGNGLSAGPTPYVAVDDVDAYLSKAKSNGARVVQEPYDVEGMGRFAAFSDAEGNRIGLWTMLGA
jgi:hypothetical protein